MALEGGLPLSVARPPLTPPAPAVLAEAPTFVGLCDDARAAYIWNSKLSISIILQAFYTIILIFTIKAPY